jgi:hypothetical protein
MRKLTSIPFALALSLALPLAAHAGVQWTAVPSGGCIIESGSASIAQYTGVGITYASGTSSTASISIHCNVITTQNSNSPNWSNLKIGWTGSQHTSEITAWVQEFTSTGGLQATSSTVSNNSTGSGTNSTTLGGGFSFDFSTYSYAVFVSITRGSSALGDVPEIVYITLY